jgi:hypothetical protein
MKKTSEDFGVFPFRVTLPRRDYSRMSERQLLRERQRMYAGLQVMWRVELEMPAPDWETLESISYQLRMLESACPELCRS